MLLVSVVLALLLSINSYAYEFVGFNDWQTIQQSMVKTDNTLRFEGLGHAYTLIGENNWSDYRLEIDIKPLKYDGEGVLHLFFRQDFLWNSYSLDITEEKTQIVRYDGSWDKYRVLAEGRGIKADEEVSITLEVIEDTFNVYFNNELVLEADSSKYKTGKIVLFSDNVAFHASNAYLKGTLDEEYTSRDRGYMPKGDSRTGGVEHMALIYGNVGSKWGVIDAYPYVGYLTSLEESGYQIEFTDYLFDSFLFLSLYAPDGHAFDSPSRGKPAAKDKWEWYLNSLFHEKEQLAAFNEAMGLVNEQLGENRKLKIYVMIPSPMVQIKDFGDVDGTGSLDFTSKDPKINTEQRFKAVKWYIEEVVTRFNNSNYENLELVGFYRLEEIVDRGIPGELDLIKKTSDFLHERDFKYFWIPYFGVDGRREYESFGFDFCIYQPNYMFAKDGSPSRLLETAKEAYKYHLGVEIEADETVLSTYKGREKFYDYLRAGVSFGYMTEATLAYYQGGRVFGAAALSSMPEQREVYDNLYKFIKGTFDEPLGSRK